MLLMLAGIGNLAHVIAAKLTVCQTSVGQFDTCSGDIRSNGDAFTSTVLSTFTTCIRSYKFVIKLFAIKQVFPVTLF